MSRPGAPSRPARASDRPRRSSPRREPAADATSTDVAAAGRTRARLQFAAAFLGAAGLTCIAFWPALGAGFVSDDVNAIVENEWVSGPFDPAAIFSNFSWWGQGRSDAPDFRPAATLTMALSHSASGSNPSAFRIVNFAMHAACAALLFALARALGLELATAMAAAALFAVLPIHSEAVIWIVGRAELGAAACFLIATLCCVRIERNGSAHNARREADIAAPGDSAARYSLWSGLGAAAAVTTGMAFKENAVTVLAVPAALAVCLGPARERLQRAAQTTAWLAAGAAVYFALRAHASGPSLHLGSRSLLDNPLSVVGAGTRLLGAVAVLGRYLWLSVWPSPLSIDYSYDALGIGSGFVADADSAVAIVAVAALAWAAWRGPGARSVTSFGILVAAASYSIVSQVLFPLGTLLGERLFYLPTAGLLLAAAAACEPLMVRTAARTITIGICAALVIVALFVDRHRAAQWSTPVSVFEAAVAAYPRSARAQMELASAYGNAGRIEDAAAHFAAARAIHPGYSAAAYNEGNTYARAGLYDRAEAAYRSAVTIQPDLTRAWYNLALTERIRGQTAAWVDAMEHATALSPDSPVLENELGEALLAAGRYEDAAGTYDRLIDGGQAVAASYFNRGVARHHAGGCTAAVDDYRKAASFSVAPHEAFDAAAGCLRELGHNDEAEKIEQAGKVANRDTRR
ncbi:MAG TPA: tetratricopeptide repeat protein [Candidatus Binatia bacterium]